MTAMEIAMSLAKRKVGDVECLIPGTRRRCLTSQSKSYDVACQPLIDHPDITMLTPENPLFRCRTARDKRRQGDTDR